MIVAKKAKAIKHEIFPRWHRDGKIVSMWLRENSSDTDVVKEVIDRRCYRKPSIGLNILPKEHWLDLGANIGTFAVCCYLHGATATCYEPVEDCFKLLRKNVPWKSFNLFQTAISVHKQKELKVWESKNPLNFYRTTIIETPAYQRCGSITNTYVEDIHPCPNDDLFWDGIKMDIEGSELQMIDEELIPDCRKLALEYHFSRDGGGDQMGKFHARMALLRKQFSIVSYAPSLNKVKKGKFPGRFDIIVHCVR